MVVWGWGGRDSPTFEKKNISAFLQGNGSNGIIQSSYLELGVTNWNEALEDLGCSFLNMLAKDQSKTFVSKGDYGERDRKSIEV